MWKEMSKEGIGVEDGSGGREGGNVVWVLK